MTLFGNGQCHLANTFFSQATRYKIHFDSDVKAMKIK